MAFTFSPPNQLTLLRILLAPVFLIFLFSSNPTLIQLSLLVFVLALLTDWYDGWVARRWGYINPFGRFLDPLADKIIISAALIAFIYLDLVPGWTVWIIVGRDVLITILRSYSEYKGKAFDATKFAKTKTALQFAAIAYVLLLHVARNTDYFRSTYAATLDALLNPTLLYAVMVALAAITLWTGLLYLLENRKTIRELYAFAFRISESE